MKRIALTILLLFYLGVSSGATMQFHYCMGKLIQWGLLQKNEVDCPQCGMDKKISLQEKCCKEDLQKISTDSSNVSKVLEFNFQQFTALAANSYFYERPVLQVTDLVGVLPFSHAPPLKESTSLFLLNCTFRI